MSMPLARYLKDFSTPAAPPPPVDSPFEMAGTDDFDMDFPALPEPDPIDVDAERREAYAQGHEAGEQAAAERFEAERQAMELAHAQALAERGEHAQEAFAQALATKLPEIIRQLSLTVSDQVAMALAPLIGDALVEKAVEELARELEAAIQSGETGTIQVRGPDELFQKLLRGMPDHVDLLRHVEDDDLDLTAEFGDAALVTRISAFSASLKKVLA